MRLNIKEWQEFKLSDLFDMKNGYFNNKPETIETFPSDNPIPFLGATAENNGVTDYCDIESIKLSDKTGQDDNTLEGKIFEGNCITITNNGSVCNAYYQPIKFTSSHDETICNPKFELNFFRAMFICSIINRERYKWSYGRKLHDLNKSKNIIIKLPIQYDDEKKPIINTSMGYSNEGYIPDWEFMENYIKSLHHKPITTKIKNNTNKELNIEQWEEFKVSDLFTMLNGKGITKEEIEENKGLLIAVQSGEENNGVLGKIDKIYCLKKGYVLTDKMCLTVARTGSAGFVSFQSEGCVVGDSAKILLLAEEIATKSIYLFLQTILLANRFKYDYGRKVTEEKYLSDILRLPIQRDETGEPIIDDNHTYSDKGYIPDWQFMEDYINSLPYSDRI